MHWTALIAKKIRYTFTDQQEQSYRDLLPRIKQTFNLAINQQLLEVSRTTSNYLMDVVLERSKQLTELQEQIHLKNELSKRNVSKATSVVLPGDKLVSNMKQAIGSSSKFKNLSCGRIMHL